MLDISKMSYSDFCLWITENDADVEYILDYKDWSVVKIEGRFYFYEHEIEGSSDDFCEVLPIAVLHYSVNNDVHFDIPPDCLFDCDFCGEQVTDDEIIYWWFKQI